MQGIRSKLSFFVLLIAYGLSGCSGSLLNPYHENFMCPDGNHGDCASVQEAYRNSFQKEAFSPMVKNKPKGGPEQVQAKEEYNYKEELYKELAGIIREPVSPMLIPSKQMRVLIPGYTEKGNLYYGHRYIYFIAREPSWMVPAIDEDKEEAR
jgi:conjugal transfer pilus assembly protein TraV